MKPILAALAVLLSVHGARAMDLDLQVLTPEQREHVMKLGEMTLPGQIEAISKDAKLELLASGRKGGVHYFDSLGPAEHSIDEITNIEGLYGKAVCLKGDSKTVIYIADDAPPSTLLHEYIHFLQMKNEKRWCELEGKLLNSDEKRERALLYHRFEFEVLKTLWDLRDKVFLNFEDKLILVEGLTRENDELKSIGVKALTDDEARRLDDLSEKVHAQIHFLTWLTHSRDDAGSVLQKMEVLSLKSCVEQSAKKNDADKINDCLKTRCSFAGIKCRKVTAKEIKNQDDLLSEIIYAWLKPFDKKDCDVKQFEGELASQIEMPTGCWKNWYAEHAKKEKSLDLKPVKIAKIAKKYGAPRLAVDHEISFFEPRNPEAFINAAYCYFIYEKVAKLDSLPIDQFSYATLGASMDLKNKADYLTWLDKSNQGQMCGKLVKAFTGELPSRWDEFGGKKRYALIMNPIAALTGGVEGLKKAYATDLNHERLHIIFGENKKVREKVQVEWAGLSLSEQNEFKQKHPSYDFKNEDILYREYFSYSRQDHPQKLF